MKNITPGAPVLPPASVRLVWFGFSHLTQWAPTAVRPRWRLYWNPTPGAVIGHGGEVFALDASQYLIMPPNTWFDQQLDKPCDTLFVHFNLGMPYDRLHGKVYSRPVSRALRREMRTLAAALQSLPHGPRVRFQLTAWICMALSTIPDADWPQAIQDARIKAVVDRLESAPQQAWGLSDLAEVAHLSRNGLIRAFRRSLGVTPCAYLQQLRLAQAEKLLAESDQTIDQIAAACGFTDRSYLSRVFAAKHRRGPAAYRKAIRAAPV